MILLVHPPATKPCEPPAGVARLKGALRSVGASCAVLDANLEGYLHLLSGPLPDAADAWTKRAVRNAAANLATLRNPEGRRGFDRYKKAASDCNRLLEAISAPYGVRLGLANYQHEDWSPVRSADLIQASMEPERNVFHPYFSHRLDQLVEELRPTLVGFSLNFLNQALCTFAMIGFLRKKHPGLPVALGGGLVTSWMRRPGWRNPFGGLVERLVAGPGEEALLSIAGVDAGSASPPPFTPDYDDASMREYLSPGVILPYSASTGCYWNRCSFCPERAEESPFIPVPSQRTAADLRSLVAIHRPALIHLLDNAVNPALMKTLIKNPPGAPWYGFARITRRLADPDFCTALARSGCVMLKLGLESGDQTVLDRLRKGEDLDVASRALAALHGAGIATYVYLLFGTPVETEASARKTLDFTIRHADSIDFLNLAIFNLPIYSPDAREVETQLHYEGDLSLYTGFSHPAGWGRGRVRRFLDREFKRNSVIASIIRRDPPFFTSNHAPFFA